MKDIEALEKIYQKLDDKQSHREEALGKVRYPAFSVVSNDETGKTIIIGQYIPHLGNSWIFRSHNRFLPLIEIEERFLHNLVIYDEFFRDIVGFHLHGNEESINFLYNLWTPMIEGEAIAALYLQNKNTFDHQIILDYLEMREPTHLWWAIKILEIREILTALKCREKEIISSTKTTYMDIDFAFAVIRKITSDSCPFSSIFCVFKNIIRKYGIMTRQHPKNAVSLLVDELRTLITAKPKEIAKFLSELFTDLSYSEYIAERDAINILDLIYTCLESKKENVRRNAMRMLLCRFDAVTFLGIYNKRPIIFLDPIADWLLNSRSNQGIPIMSYGQIQKPTEIIKVLNEYSVSLDNTESPHNIINLQRLGLLGKTFESNVEQIRIKYAKRFFTELSEPEIYTKRYGSTLTEAGSNMINGITKILADYQFFYKNRDQYKRESDLLYETINKFDMIPDAAKIIFNSNLQEVLFAAGKNSARLLEGFDSYDINKALKSLLVDVITDYKFAETLVNEQIKPALDDLVTPLDDPQIMPYFYY